MGACINDNTLVRSPSDNAEEEKDSMPRLILRGSVILFLLALLGAALPAAASARAPSHAVIRFKVPSTIAPFDPSSSSTTVHAIVSWTPGSSPTGAGCCTSRIFDNGTFTGQTSGDAFPTTLHVGGFQIGPYRIKSFDSHGTFVGSVLADPAFANDFEDAYIDDHGSDCDSADGFTGSWTQVINGSNEGGASCLSTTAGDSFTFASGIDNAWVTTTGPTHGSARIYIDGNDVRTVSTYSKTTRYRRIVWARRFGTLTGHTITIVNAGTSGHPAIEVDADIFMGVD
jgi:hypothetical protein